MKLPDLPRGYRKLLKVRMRNKANRKGFLKEGDTVCWIHPNYLESCDKIFLTSYRKENGTGPFMVQRIVLTPERRIQVEFTNAYGKSRRIFLNYFAKCK